MKEISKEVKAKHDKNIWMVFACIFLGVWLLFSHCALGYKTFSMVISDIAIGALVFFAGIFALKVNRFGFFCLWVICFSGLYLNFAPLLFWAKAPVEYLNDTVIGILLTLFSIIIPGIPGKIEGVGHEIPAGWSYNPSSWLQRLPVIVLGIIGMFISRYLAAYQLGYITTVWDPIFGNETKEVITSTISNYFPVADAGLGCFAYTVEVLLGLKGAENRWRTMPWLVVSFVFLVVPLGVVSIMLVILQPLIVRDWCFLCLCTAVSMIFMIVFAVDELLAVFQFLYRSTKSGNGFWKTFWKGGDLPQTKDAPKISIAELKLKDWLVKPFQGATLRWNLLLSAVIGVLLMLTPKLVGFSGIMSNIDHLLGSLIFVVGILSLAEVIRKFRFINIFFGFFIIVLSWMYTNSAIYHTIFGFLLIFLSIPQGKIKETYGQSKNNRKE